jgi:hypothetical protein
MFTTAPDVVGPATREALNIIVSCDERKEVVPPLNTLDVKSAIKVSSTQ